MIKIISAFAMAMGLAQSVDYLPEKPVSELDGVSTKALANAQFVKKDDLILYGAVIDGTHYTSECRGGQPCWRVPLMSFSLAKSMTAGVALMRLEKLYPGAKDALVSDYVPACSHWSGVTFNHLLSMASGHFGSKVPYADENAHIVPFIAENTAEGKSAYVCTKFPNTVKPGSMFLYRSFDTWLLSDAMQAFWREKSGRADADYYHDLVAPLWADMGLSTLMGDTRRTGGIPNGGWGMTFVRGDVVAVAHALATNDPRLTDKLDSDMLADAMQWRDKPVGLKADDLTMRYINGFWAYNAGQALTCTNETWVPFMSGWGGISIVMLPTGDVYYIFSDGHVYRFKEVLEEIHKARPICS